jgi:hypothetical protein
MPLPNVLPSASEVQCAEVELKSAVRALTNRFQATYPGLVFAFEWDSGTVSTEAWVDADGVKRVLVHGGFVRHPDIGLEALAVALAHEVAHHFPAGPTYSNGLSCELWADYWGVKEVMPRVWGDDAASMSERGIAQLAAFWRVANDPRPIAGAKAGCGYPPSPCRVATLHAARSSAPMPDCA